MSNKSARALLLLFFFLLSYKIIFPAAKQTTHVVTSGAFEAKDGAESAGKSSLRGADAVSEPGEKGEAQIADITADIHVLPVAMRGKTPEFSHLFFQGTRDVPDFVSELIKDLLVRECDKSTCPFHGALILEATLGAGEEKAGAGSGEKSREPSDVSVLVREAEEPDTDPYQCELFNKTLEELFIRLTEKLINNQISPEQLTRLLMWSVDFLREVPQEIIEKISNDSRARRDLLFFGSNALEITHAREWIVRHFDDGEKLPYRIESLYDRECRSRFADWQYDRGEYLKFSEGSQVVIKQFMRECRRDPESGRLTGLSKFRAMNCCYSKCACRWNPYFCTNIEYGPGLYRIRSADCREQAAPWCEDTCCSLGQITCFLLILSFAGTLAALQGGAFF